MLNPGNIDFFNGSFAVPAAGTFTTSPIENKAGVLALALRGELAYGSGGTSIKAYVQTSFDKGVTWIDIATFAFTTANKVRAANLSKLTPVTTLYTPTDGSLADDTVKDGLLGDRYRVKYVIAGTYAGSTLKLNGDIS